MPKAVLSSLSLILVQSRNRRTGTRRTLQLAEIDREGNPNVLMQLDVVKDQLLKAAEAKRTMDTLFLYTGMTPSEMKRDIEEKTSVLRWLVSENITDVHQIGLVMSKYYSGKLSI